MDYKKHIFKYLIDIVIITIGVIIAFYLTKYGERLSKHQNEQDVVKQIYFELKDNLLDLERDFVIHKTGLISHINVMKFLDREIEMTDSLIMDFYWMTKEEYIFANVSGYENLKSLGINLIGDDTLRNLITLIYNHNFPRLSKGNTLYPDINEYLSPFFKDHFKVNRDTSLKYTLQLDEVLKVTYPLDVGLGTKQFIGYSPLDAEALRSNTEFQFLTSKSFEYRRYKYAFYQKCIQNVKMAMEHIEKKY